MAKLKEFWDKHKTKVLMVGGVIIGGTILILTTKNTKENDNTDSETKQLIEPKDDVNNDFNYEKVVDFLDKNKNVDSKYAIFRDGLDLDSYSVLDLTDNVVY